MRSLLFLAAIGLLAALSGWFLDRLESQLSSEHGGADLPQLVIRDFIATRMNLTGIRQYTLAAPQLTQLPKDEGTRLQQPVLDVFLDGWAILWNIRAEQGWISADNQRIRLENQVQAERPASSGLRPVEIYTEDLTILPEQEFLQTDAPVRLVSQGVTVEGVGLKAYLKEDRLQLLQQVRGVYEPVKP